MNRLFIISLSISFASNCWARFEYKLEKGETLQFAQEKHDADGSKRWKLIFSGLTDFRLSQSGEERSWQDANANNFGGEGILRYGGKDKDLDGKGDQDGPAFHLAKFDLLMEVKKSRAKVAHFHLMYDESGNEGLVANRIGLFEGFLTHTWKLSEDQFFNIKGGLFLPGISLENHGIGWSSDYSLTPSAINSWFGEELRYYGLQGTLRQKLNKWSVDGMLGLFSGNDGLGTVLSWRGWALHDQFSAFGRRLRLRENNVITTGLVDPFTEIDNKLGVNLKLEASWNRLVNFHYFYLDTNGDQEIMDPTTVNWAWETKFHHLGLKMGPYSGFEILMQGLKGSATANMGSNRLLKNDYEAIYLLVSKSWDVWQVASRFDKFRVIDRDTHNDKNYQNGAAYLLTGSYQFHPRQKLRLETIFTRTERKGNETFTTFNKVEDELVQLSYQLVF